MAFEVCTIEITPAIRAVVMCLFFYITGYYFILIIGSFCDLKNVSFKSGISNFKIGNIFKPVEDEEPQRPSQPVIQLPDANAKRENEPNTDNEKKDAQKPEEEKKTSSLSSISK